MSKFFLSVLKVIPLDFLISFVLDVIKGFTKQSQTTIDDKAVAVIEIMLQDAEITWKGVKMPKYVEGFFVEVVKQVTFKSLVEYLLAELDKLAKQTDTKFDDLLVAMLRAILKEAKIID